MILYTLTTHPDIANVTCEDVVVCLGCIMIPCIEVDQSQKDILLSHWVQFLSVNDGGLH